MLALAPYALLTLLLATESSATATATPPSEVVPENAGPVSGEEANGTGEAESIEPSEQTLEPQANEIETESTDPTPEPSAATGVAPPADDASETVGSSGVEEDDGVELIEVVGRSVAGSSYFVDEEYLERYEHDDVLKVLLSVPGVYVRQEDGYGLRPNIGMRGSGSERSAKITLMEDGVLFAPAPYSRPAAYFFPLLTKMIGIEVLKGPSAIRHGPATVGGSVNMLQRPIPETLTTSLDLAAGTDLYGKGHIFHGGSTEHFGWLVEGVKLRSDGFKVLDNGGPTGFDKNDMSVRFRWNNSRSAAVGHELEIEAGYEDEVSHESYVGVTTDDFAKTPYRRYAATQRDKLQWQRNDQRLTYRLSSDTVRVVAQLYRNWFHRDWDKLNRFNVDDVDNSIRVIMLNPKGSNVTLYKILTGQRDSYIPTHWLMLGSNDRYFISQGAQVKATLDGYWFGVQHWLEAGARLHYDSARLDHREDPYFMRSGTLVRAPGEQKKLLDAKDTTLAWAGYYHHQVQVGKFQFNVGARGELISTKHEEKKWNVIPPGIELQVENRYFVFIPGGGVVYTPLPELELLAGVHRGFVPSTPTGGKSVDPEDSVNYEAGFRFNTRWLSGEAIGFFSDFRNLIGSCSSSSGCPSRLVGTEFNGGSVHSYGAEVQASAEIPVHGSIVVPARVAYTYQKSIFQEDFISDNPEWGTVLKGFEVPYIPHHQVYFSTGLRGTNWGLEGYVHYTSKMRDIASIEKKLGAPTEATLVFNAAAHYTVENWGRAYLLVENVLDQPYIVSRRPMGARSGVPRRFVVGYKNTFQ